MAYRFGLWELDPERYELRQQGQVCGIEPQVFDLLLYLIRHPRPGCRQRGVAPRALAGSSGDRCNPIDLRQSGTPSDRR